MHLDCIRSIVLSLDNKIIISSSYDTTIIVWRHKTFKPIHRINTSISVKGGRVETLKLSYDEKLIIFGVYFGTRTVVI